MKIVFGTVIGALKRVLVEIKRPNKQKSSIL